MQATQQTTALHIRWMIRRDMEEVLAIEAGSYLDPWSEQDFLAALRGRNVIGMVCEAKREDGPVFGFMVYALHKRHIHILDMAVGPAYRRRGIGAAMVAKLKEKTLFKNRKRPVLCLECRETNLGALLFWKAQGFIATDVLRGFYEDTDEDAIVMKWRENARDS